MKYFLLLLTLGFPPVFSQSEDEDFLRNLKTVEWPKAYREQDTVLLNKILADEFQKIDANGVGTTKRQELAYIKVNKPSYQSFRFSITRLDIFENGTAVVSGTGLIKGVEDGTPYEITYTSSNILIKQKNQWKAINSHVSGVKRK